jgi:hypothetical protein
MRALILRRVALIENCAGGPVLIGPALNPDMVRLQGFLTRNGYPHQVLDPAADTDAKVLVERYAPDSRICRSPFVPTGPCSRIRAQRSSRAASAWWDTTPRIEPTTSRSSAPDRPALRPLSMPPRKVCR